MCSLSINLITSSTIDPSIISNDQCVRSRSINFGAIERQYNIKADETGIADWLQNDRPLVVTDELFKCQIDYEKSQFIKQADLQQSPSLHFSFRGAIEFLLATIIKRYQEYGPEETISLKYDNMQSDLIRGLSSIEVPRHWTLPMPPRYETDSALSADTRTWLGALLSILHDQGHINAFGRKGCDWWIGLDNGNYSEPLLS